MSLKFLYAHWVRVEVYTSQRQFERNSVLHECDAFMCECLSLFESCLYLKSRKQIHTVVETDENLSHFVF